MIILNTIDWIMFYAQVIEMILNDFQLYKKRSHFTTFDVGQF